MSWMDAWGGTPPRVSITVQLRSEPWAGPEGDVAHTRVVCDEVRTEGGEE